LRLESSGFVLRTDPMIMNRAIIRRRELLAFVAGGFAVASNVQGSESQSRKQEKMQASNGSNLGAPALHFSVSPRGWARLLPEQEAALNLTVSNHGGNETKIFALTGNRDTPVFQIFDERGEMLGEVDPAVRARRVTGHVKPVPGARKVKSLAPGAQEATWVNLWKYIDPLPPGRYGVEATHIVDEEGSFVRSERIAFEIVPASVSMVRSSYGSHLHDTSFVVWVAHPTHGGDPSELLLRLSAFGKQTLVQNGATSLGNRGGMAWIALSAPTERSSENGWVAVASGHGFEMIFQEMTIPRWRSGPLDLGLSGLQPVPRFPDRT
jgi:hypothetical protein